MTLITYDITSDKIRNKVSKILLDYGRRVQYSVFESDMTEKELERVLKKIKSLIDTTTDNVKFYYLCLGCEKKTLSLGLDKSYKLPETLVI